MSENPAIVSLRNLCNQAEKEVQKTRAVIEKAQKKLEESETRLATLKDALAHIVNAEPVTEKTSLQDDVYNVIALSGDAGVTAKEIASSIVSRRGTGDVAALQNSVHVTASRLVTSGVIESFDSDSGKRFRKRGGDSGKDIALGGTA